MNDLLRSLRIVHANRDKSGRHLCGGVGTQYMRTLTLTVLAALAVLLLAVSGVAANGSNDTASDHDRIAETENASADEWATWMEQHMTEHIGADAAAQMQDRMGMSYEEMGEHMASSQNRSMMDRGLMSGMMNEDMSERSCH